MRTINLSLITRDDARDFCDQRASGAHPMDAVYRAALRFREYDAREEGRDLQRVALRLEGNELPDIGLEYENASDWEHLHGIWGTYICRESTEAYCRRMFAIMVSAEHADALEADLRAVMGDTVFVIQALTSILTGCRENEGPALEASWPGDEIVPADERTCVLLALHVNGANPRGSTPGWRVLRNAAVTGRGVSVGEVEFRGFAELHSLFHAE